MDPFEELGIFWLPEDPDITRPGKLTFGHGRAGIDLTLLNPFEDTFPFMATVGSHPGYPLIFGLLESGQPVTLTHAQVGGSTLSLGGFGVAKVQLRPQYIFRGAHLADGGDSKFTRFRVDFDHLDAWAFSGPPVTMTVENGNSCLHRDRGGG